MSITATVAIYVGDKILEHIIQEEIWYKRFVLKIKKPTDYRSRLIDVIELTIAEFGENYQYDSSGGKFPFYQSQIFLEHLSGYILFDKSSIQTIQSDFTAYPKIIPPTTDDLNNFYSLFISKAQKDDKLKKQFFNENYKTQIFKLSAEIKEIREVTSAIKNDTGHIKSIVDKIAAVTLNGVPQEAEFLSAFRRQVERQIEKQSKSEKYLRNTFIETNDYKDKLRAFCNPLKFTQKLYEEILRFDFRYLNILLERRGLSSFVFDFSAYKPDSSMTIRNIESTHDSWKSYLTEKRKEIIDMKMSSNDKWTFDNKFRDSLDFLTVFSKRIAVITEVAGQGKTNFVCDLAERFLLTHNTSCLFLTGAEIDANNIRTAIIKKVFPNHADFAFTYFLDQIKNACESTNQNFIFIIDGLNENINPALLSSNLQNFIEEMMDYPNIKFILTCRTEYYDANFLNFESSLFKDSILKITNLIKGRSEEIQEKLLATYFSHFQITIGSMSKSVRDQLSDNFLLLRIFCESHRGDKITYLENIYKEELFEKYYTIKTTEVISRIEGNNRSSSGLNVKNFLRKIISFMVEKHQFFSIPLDSLLAEEQEKEIYIEFLDENLLVKRDLLPTGNGVFTNSEVVNFTFDEFRDYLISKYLVEVVFPESEENFNLFLEDQLTDRSPIQEGCSTFLFFIGRKSNNSKLNEILKKQNWYPNTYATCIFSLNDSVITKEDKLHIKNWFLKNDNIGIAWNLLSRRNTQYYKNLNILFLFEILRELPEQTYRERFVSAFGTGRSNNNLIDQDSYIKRMDQLAGEIDEDSIQHPLFELAVYMFTNTDSWRIEAIYEKYYFRFKDKSKDQLRLALTSQNNRLVREITNFINRYEIQL